jgi:glutamine synthetase
MAVAQLPAGVHTVDLVVPDLVGTLRGKKVPANRWSHVAHHGVAIANAIFVWDARCGLNFTCQYANMATGFPDVEIVPDVSTLRETPWRPGSAIVLCDTVELDGSPCVMAPRQVLRNVLARAASMGYDVSIGFEVEFYLLDPATLLPHHDDIQTYSPLRANADEDVIAPIRKSLIDLGMIVEASNTEYGPGQHEINIQFDDALRTADNAVLFRHVVRDVAAQHGKLATFMAKPLMDHSGCGMHLHQSLWRDGRNLFAHEGKLSELGRWYLGGLQAHMRSNALLGSSTVNAMRRRQPYTFCPTTDAWGVDNRTVGLRVIHGPDTAVRIEQRDGSSDCNPYLVIAAQIAAGLHGVEQRIEPRSESNDDEYERQLGESLPTTIPDAIKLLNDSALVGDTFDPLIVDAIAAIAQADHDGLHALDGFDTDTVAPAERGWYARAV